MPDAVLGAALELAVLNSRHVRKPRVLCQLLSSMPDLNSLNGKVCLPPTQESSYLSYMNILIKEILICLVTSGVRNPTTVSMAYLSKTGQFPHSKIHLVLTHFRQGIVNMNKLLDDFKSRNYKTSLMKEQKYC